MSPGVRNRLIANHCFLRPKRAIDNITPGFFVEPRDTESCKVVHLSHFISWVQQIRKFERSVEIQGHLKEKCSAGEDSPSFLEAEGVNAQHRGPCDPSPASSCHLAGGLGDGERWPESPWHLRTVPPAPSMLAVPRPASPILSEQEQKRRVFTKLNIFISSKRNSRTAPG